MPEIQLTAANEQHKYYPLSGTYHVQRNSFWTAGQDSHTKAPAQQPDLFESLDNIEPITRGILERRRGYSLFSNTNPTVDYTRSYGFRSDNLNLRELVWSSTSQVDVTDESGNILNAPLFTPSGTQAPRMVLSRDFGYFADGAADDSLKWDGTQSPTALSKWGIGIATVGSLIAGPKAPTAAASNAGSGVGWTNPANVEILDGNSATVTLGASLGLQSNNLYASNFGFSIGTNIIQGIQVDVFFKSSTTLKIANIVAPNTGEEANGLTLNPFPPPKFETTYVLITTTTPHGFSAGQVVTIAGDSGTDPIGPGTFLITSIVNSTQFKVDFTRPNGGSVPVPLGGGGTATVSAGGTTTAPIFQVALTADGVTQLGTSHSTTSLPASISKVTFGGPNDLWGTASFVPNSNFGVFMSTTLGSGWPDTTFSVDFVQITLFFVPLALNATIGAAGNITLLNGRVYYYAFQRSNTGTTSGLSNASLSTGPVTSKQINLSNIGISNDPQVDTVLILATADGGDQTTLYELARLPNGTTTYTDNTPDALTASVPTGPSLLTSNVWQDTDIFGNLHGIANNDLPPIAFFPTKHKGRLYMANGPNLFFSKNLDDITTSTGTITTKWEEAWPATNVLDISQQDETIQGLLSDGETLWIGTERSIRRLVGDSPANFQIPEVQFNEAGLLSQEVWKIVMFEGQPVGVMWLTPDLRLMSSDFNTYKDIGTPIQDVLNSINNSALSSAHACFVSGAAFDLYMLYIPTGTNTTPDTVCVYNIRSQRWTIWNPTDTVTTSLFNIAVNGIPQWLFASGAGPLYFWDPSVNVDRNGGVTSTYPASAQTSWLDLGDATMRKALNQILITTSDVGLSLTVFGATTDGDLDSGAVTIATNIPVQTGPLGDIFVPLAGYVTKYRWYKFLFTSSNSTTQDVLDAFNLEVIPFHRW